MQSESVYAIYANRESGDRQRIFVDPYQAKVTGVQNYGANETVVVTLAALLLIISLITGLIIWWPINA